MSYFWAEYSYNFGLYKTSKPTDLMEILSDEHGTSLSSRIVGGLKVIMELLLFIFWPRSSRVMPDLQPRFW